MNTCSHLKRIHNSINIRCLQNSLGNLEGPGWSRTPKNLRDAKYMYVLRVNKDYTQRKIGIKQYCSKNDRKAGEIRYCANNLNRDYGYHLWPIWDKQFPTLNSSVGQLKNNWLIIYNPWRKYDSANKETLVNRKFKIFLDRFAGNFSGSIYDNFISRYILVVIKS